MLINCIHIIQKNCNFLNVYNNIGIANFTFFRLYCLKIEDVIKLLNYTGLSLDELPLYGGRDGKLLCFLKPGVLTFSPFLIFMGEIGSTAG